MTGRRGAAVHALGASTSRSGTSAARRPACPPGSCSARRRARRFTPVRLAAAEPRRLVGRLQPGSRRPGGLGARVSASARRSSRSLMAGPYAHEGLDGPDERMVEMIAGRAREPSGPTSRSWSTSPTPGTSVEHALAVIETWAEYDVFFVETPLWTDDLERLRRARASARPIQIAAGRVAGDPLRVPRPHGSWRRPRRAAGRRARRGPDRGAARLRACRRARPAGRSARLEDRDHDRGDRAAGGGDTGHMPFFEFVPQEVAESPAAPRARTRDELELVDGRLALPRKPGLGIELDAESARALRCARRGTPLPRRRRPAVE